MSILQTLEEGDVITVDGSKHPTFPDGYTKCKVIIRDNAESKGIEVTLLDNDSQTNHIIFPEESDCILPPHCEYHGKKVYSKTNQGWICPFCREDEIQ